MGRTRLSSRVPRVLFIDLFFVLTTVSRHLWLITEHTHGNMKFIDRENVKFRQQVNFRDGLKRKCRTENTLFEHVHNTSPIPNAEISRSGLVNCIRNKNSVLDVAMFLVNLRRKNYFDNLTNNLNIILKGQVPNF